jgi:hypothetical protein
MIVPFELMSENRYLARDGWNMNDGHCPLHSPAAELTALHRRLFGVC